MFQKLANFEGVGLQIEKILDNFTLNDPMAWDFLYRLNNFICQRFGL